MKFILQNLWSLFLKTVADSRVVLPATPRVTVYRGTTVFALVPHESIKLYSYNVIVNAIFVNVLQLV